MIFRRNQMVREALSGFADELRRQQIARAIAKPLGDAVRSAKLAAWREGRSPSIVCLGRRQEDTMWDYAEAGGAIGLPERISGLRTVWTNDPDCVAVYEERPGGWF